MGYDWVVKTSKVYYPGKWKLEIKGIKCPSKAGGNIEDGYDWKLVLFWLQ